MSALPPQLAVAYLRALSCDVRAVAVHGPGGAVLAQDGVLAGDIVRARQADHGMIRGGPAGNPQRAKIDAGAGRERCRALLASRAVRELQGGRL